MVVTIDELSILKDISDELIAQVMKKDKSEIDTITNVDMEDIKETILLIIDSYVNDNLVEFRSYKFKDLVEKHVTYIVENSDILCDLDFDYQIVINSCIEFYFTMIMQPRHHKSYEMPILDKKYIEKRIDILRNKPQPDQRTAEWYLFRGKHITASSAWKSFESQKTQNQLIYSKCAPIDVKKKSGVNINSACHHGHKYEPLSTMIYEKINNTIIEEFGCLEDDDTKYLAASPDGINVEKTSPLYGRLLEIKNPKSREISGIPKNEYWVQMQFQMHVAKLHICDFLETTFQEYENEEAFMNDGTFARSHDDKHKGIIICFNDGNGPIYKYSPLDVSKKQFDEWYENELEENKNLSWIENVWWKTKVYSCVTVLYNKEWFDVAKPYFKKIWDTILKEQISGYDHRKATKRVIKKPANIIIPESTLNVIRIRTQSFDDVSASNNN
jgi:putative phage-type endonuclease